MGARFLLVLLMGIPCAMVGSWNTNQADRSETSNEQAIKTAIQNYQDGFNQRDPQLLRQAFHEETGHVKSVSRTDEGTDRCG